MDWEWEYEIDEFDICTIRLIGKHKTNTYVTQQAFSMEDPSIAKLFLLKTIIKKIWHTWHVNSRRCNNV